MSKQAQLLKLIRTVVQQEIRNALNEQVEHVVKEVMTNLITEAPIRNQATVMEGNSHKRRRMVESVQADEYDDYATMDYSSTDILESAAGTRPSPRHTHNANSGLNIPTKAITEGGNVVDINPAAVPDFVIAAMNKDYSSMLKNISNGSAQ